MRWGSRGLAAILVVSFVVALGALPASAEAADPLLPGGASLGEVSGLGTTESVGSDGPCTSDDHPDGYGHAAVYRIPAAAYRLLRMTVSDDGDGSLSLCRIALHQDDGSSGEPPSSPEVAAWEGCASASSCSLDRWLEAATSYVIVLWSAPPDPSDPDVDAASFSFDASVKLPSNLTTKIHGRRIKDQCTGYNEVVNGKVFTIGSTSTAVSTGTVTITLQRKVSPSVWTHHATYHRAMSGGKAMLSLKAGSGGSYRVTTTLAETPTRLGVTKVAYLKHVTPKWKRYSDGGVRLKVPWYHQQHRLSCEAATLRMAHNYFKPGAIDRDWDVLKIVGVDKRPKKGNRWGNPNKHFVGKVNGRMMKTGYGVHFGPIARAATTYSPCRPAITLKKPSRATIARYVASGFPVIVWGAHRGATGIYKKRWKAWDGQWITAWSVEHTWVVVGFHGSADKPRSFIVHDPSGAARKKVSLKAFDAFTKYFRRAVVVRG